MITESECMAAAALELTSAAVFQEETLAEYVQARVSELQPAQLVELITLLAAVAGATYEAWAEDTDRPVAELLNAAGMHIANRPDPSD